MEKSQERSLKAVIRVYRVDREPDESMPWVREAGEVSNGVKQSRKLTKDGH